VNEAYLEPWVYLELGMGCWKVIDRDGLWLTRNPSRIDVPSAHCLQADFTGLIPPWQPDSF